VSLGFDPLFLDRAVYALRSPDPRHPTPDTRKTLVCLFQRGAVDGLSMVIPHGDEQYYRERPRIAIPRKSLVDLDGHFGLHPELAPLKPFWDNKSLTAVHAVGSPDSTRSHFDAQDYMESGTTGVKSTPDGWANRYCQNAAEHVNTPFRAVAFGPQLPRILAGTSPALAIDDLRAFGVRARTEAATDRLTRAFQELYENNGPATGLLAQSAEESFEAIRMLKSANPGSLAPEHGAEYPPGRLGQSLSQIAQLIKANLGVEIAFADVGGWDTHVNQIGEYSPLTRNLRLLDRSVVALKDALGPAWKHTAVLIVTEFGRTVAPNGSNGTDHGTAGAAFVAGGAVRGGRIIADWPGLGERSLHEGRDLRPTLDMRALFKAALIAQLSLDEAALETQVFPGSAGIRPLEGLFT